NDVDWSTSRIAYQVKAMLENAELSIGKARQLTDSALLSRTDKQHSDLRDTIGEIKKRWESAQLPKDLRRLAVTISEMTWLLRMRAAELGAAVDEATEAGQGAKTLNLSPYGAILASLIRKRGAALFEPLGLPKNRDDLFVPLEVELPTLTADVSKHI